MFSKTIYMAYTNIQYIQKSSFLLSLAIIYCFLIMGSLEVEKKTIGWAAKDPSGVLSPYSYTLRCFNLHYYILMSSSLFSTIIITELYYYFHLQKDRPWRCWNQGVVLWTLSYWSSPGQEWSWHVQLPHGSWVFTLLSRDWHVVIMHILFSFSFF